MLKEAVLYEKLGNGKVHCFLCSHHCRIAPDQFGICGVRQNQNGTLWTLVYGDVIAEHVDPIEKKPLYHFLPGSKSYSIATIGCNFKCSFCQNWQISQVSKKAGNIKGEEVIPEDIVRIAKKERCESISYTYTEPTIFFEYAYDIAKLAKKEGILNNFVTNGYMTKEAIEMIRPYLDSANVDLKFFDDDSYKRMCGGKLQPVLDSIRHMHDVGIWIEVTTLVLPGKNDSMEQLKGIAEFIANIDKDIPWHISRFHPDYEFLNIEPTHIETLINAKAIGGNAGLRYVYLGNTIEGNNTYCPDCKNLLIEREIFSIMQNNIKNSKCQKCNTKIQGVFYKED
jgi:pyruvate formate lyase activating enzyme